MNKERATVKERLKLHQETNPFPLSLTEDELKQAKKLRDERINYINELKDASLQTDRYGRPIKEVSNRVSTSSPQLSYKKNGGKKIKSKITKKSKRNFKRRSNKFRKTRRKFKRK